MGRWMAKGLVAVVGIAIMIVVVRMVRSPMVEEVLTFDGRLLGGAQVDAGVVVAGRVAADTSLGVRLVRLDPVTGRVEVEATLEGVVGIDDVAGFDGSALMRLRGPRLPEVPMVDQLPGGTASTTDDLWLVVLDGRTLAPIRQIRLPDIDALVYEPLTVLDGKVWFHGSRDASGSRSWFGTVDLATGDMTATETRHQPGPPGVRNVQHTATSVVVVRRAQIRILDRSTGAPVLEHTFADPLPMAAGGFVFHEGSFWMSGSADGDRSSMYRYDPATGARRDPRPAGELPVWTFDAGDERWELFERDGERQAVPFAEPEPDSVWRRVDIETAQVRAEYHLGRWRVRFLTEDHAWLVRLGEDGGAVLGRMGL